jgi:hypothetical protein
MQLIRRLAEAVTEARDVRAMHQANIATLASLPLSRWEAGAPVRAARELAVLVGAQRAGAVAGTDREAG